MLHDIIKSCIQYVLLSAFVITVHAMLDFQYQALCRTNLINILFFGNSTFCQILGNIVFKTEKLSLSFFQSFMKAFQA